MPRCSPRHRLQHLARVADHDGAARQITVAKRNGRYAIAVSAPGDNEPTSAEPGVADASAADRRERLERMVDSGRFTTTELRTLRCLIVEQLTILEIAARERCTRQAIVARLVGNSKGQGGLVRKADRFWREWEEALPVLPAVVPHE